MSNFRDFLFNRDHSAGWTLALAMVGIRMGERQLLVGDDAALFAQLASKGGLTGQVVVVVGSEDAAARIEAAASALGVLVEDIRRAALPGLPVQDGTFDVAVVNAGPSFLALTPAERDSLAVALHRALRTNGRLIVIEGQPPRLLGLKRAQPAGLEAFHAAGGAERLLEGVGFRPVRLLANREGQRFTEGIKGGTA
jgi:SAM-dependent methyltransferase